MREKIFSEATLLVVGNVNDDITMFTDEAAQGGAHITVVQSGLEALTAMRNNEYTAVLIDEFTAELDAEEILTSHTHEGHSVANVIVYSDKPSAESEGDLKDMGIYAYIALGVDSASRLHNSVIALLDGLNVQQSVSIEQPGSPAKIVFVVEDSVFIRDFISAKLIESGFAVASADNGETAVAKIREAIPAVVLLDLELPGRHGLEVLHDLKADAELQGIPVIIFTNEHDEGIEEKTKAAGAAGFFFKASTDPQELIRQINAVTA